MRGWEAACWPLSCMVLFVFYILYPSLPPNAALRPPSQLLTSSNNPLFISFRAETRRTTQRRTPEEIINHTQAHTVWLVGYTLPVCPFGYSMIPGLYHAYRLHFIQVWIVIDYTRAPSAQHLRRASLTMRVSSPQGNKTLRWFTLYNVCLEVVRGNDAHCIKWVIHCLCWF